MSAVPLWPELAPPGEFRGTTVVDELCNVLDEVPAKVRNWTLRWSSLFR
jgi:hypothetical protein